MESLLYKLLQKNFFPHGDVQRLCDLVLFLRWQWMEIRGDLCTLSLMHYRIYGEGNSLHHFLAELLSLVLLHSRECGGNTSQ